MTRQEKFARALLRPINTAAIILLGIYTVVWGFWLANPFWTVFTTAPLYSALAAIAPELFWGSVAIVVGIITIYGAYRRSYRALVVGSVTAGWHWTMIAAMYFMGDWMNTGGITSLTFAVYAAFIYLNIRVNHRQRNKEIEELFS